MTIFLFKTHPINVTNLAQTLLLENAKDVSFEACQYTINNKFIDLVALGNFAQSMRSDIKSWRTQDWSRSLDILESKIAEAELANKTIIFGSHLDNQIKFLKDYFKDQITTVAINYNEDMYSLLLRNVAEYHIYLNSSSESVDHYINEFDSMNLIPHTSITNCDYTIQINDFFDYNKLDSHFQNLKFPFTLHSKELYESWLSNW